jgi:hypothetical protein
MPLAIHVVPTGLGAAIVTIGLVMAAFFAASMADVLVGMMASTFS